MSGFYGQVYQVIEKRNFDKDVFIGKSLTVNENANIKQDLEVEKNLTVNENANVKQDLEIGKSLTVNENASVKQDLQVEKNLTVNENVNVKQGLHVGENILIQGNQISIKGSLGEEDGTYDSLVFLKDNDEVVASIAANNVGTLVFDLPLKNSDYFERYCFTGSEENLTEDNVYYILTSKNVADNWLSILKEEDGAKLSLTEEGYLVAKGFKNETTTIQSQGIATDFIETSELQVQSNQAMFVLPSDSQELQIIIGNSDNNGSYTTYTLDAMTNNETFKILTNYNFKENTLLWVDTAGNFSTNWSDSDPNEHFFNGKGLALGETANTLPDKITTFSADDFTGLYINGPITQTGGHISLTSASISIGSLLSQSDISLNGKNISLQGFTGINIYSASGGISLQGVAVTISATGAGGAIFLNSGVSISGIATLKNYLVLDEVGKGTTKGKGRLRCFNLQKTADVKDDGSQANPQLHVFRVGVEDFVDYDGTTKSGAAGFQCGGIFLENGFVNAYGTANLGNVTTPSTSPISMYEGRLYFQITS